MERVEPLISILIPCYNNQQYIYELLQSIFEQKYHNLEVLIGDDASSSFDVDTLIQWLNVNRPEWMGRISIYQNEINVGTVANFEILQEKSRGDYLFHIAADDVLDNEHVMEELVGELNCVRQRGEDAQVVMGQLEMWDHELKNKLNDFIEEDIIELLKKGDTKALFNECVLRVIFPPQFIYARCLLEKLGKLSKQYRYIEDWPTALRLLRQGVRFYYMDKTPVAKHRAGGISHGNKHNSARVYLRYYSELIECYKNEVEPWKDLLPKDKARKAEKLAQDRMGAFCTIHIPTYIEKMKLVCGTAQNNPGVAVVCADGEEMRGARQNEMNAYDQLPLLPASRKQKVKLILKKNARLKNIWMWFVVVMLCLIGACSCSNSLLTAILWIVDFAAFIGLLGGLCLKIYQIYKYGFSALFL